DSLIGVSGASWGPDNFIYADAFHDDFGLLRVEAKPGARPSWFTTLDTARGEIDHAWPDVLPNGKGVLFTVRFRGKNGARSRISWGSRATGKRGPSIVIGRVPMWASRPSHPTGSGSP